MIIAEGGELSCRVVYKRSSPRLQCIRQQCRQPLPSHDNQILKIAAK